LPNRRNTSLLIALETRTSKSGDEEFRMSVYAPESSRRARVPAELLDALEATLIDLQRLMTAP
jgi:hypothetical protein